MSIIVPVFNRAALLPATIESVLNQTVSSWELILVDDGSNDSSREVAVTYAATDIRIQSIERPQSLPKGANACRNFGFERAKGTFVKWLDSDDLLTPHALSIQLEPFMGNDDLQVCFGQGEYFDSESGNSEGLWSRNVFSDNIFSDYIRNQIRWPVGGPLWRRDYFEVPPFHNQLRNSQEWLMHALQLVELKEKQYCIIDKIIYKIRRGNERMSSKSNRTPRYFYNEYLARVILYRHLTRGIPFSDRLELRKQMAIYYFHFLKGKLFSL